MGRQLTIWSGLAIALALTGCGSSQPGRTSGGMATGAGTGAAIGIIGGPIGIVVGAAVGAGAGALTATNTSPQTVNLGDPLWAHSPGATVPATNPAVVGQTAQAQGGYGAMAPPQPLQSGPGAGYYPQTAQTVQPSPGATALPPSPPVQSQPLTPAK